MGFSRVGDQFELALDDVRLKCSPEPWEGRSPRDLTRVALSGIFKARAGRLTDFIRFGQYDLFD